MGYFIKDLTYEEVERFLDEDSVVMLPIGGGSKEHGAHLPMGTDYYVTDWLAEQVTGRCNVMTLPTLPYAYFPAFVEWKGSVSIQYEHFIRYVEDILLSFVRFGVKKFLILDGGVSTHIPLKLLALEMNNQYQAKVAVSDITGLGKEVSSQVCEQKRGGHGDEEETSAMLHIRPDLVQMDKATEEYTAGLPGCSGAHSGVVKVYLPNRMCTPHGTNGNSRLADADKGRKILEAQVEDLVTFLENFCAWTPGDLR